jgi:hypothetical protein
LIKGWFALGKRLLLLVMLLVSSTVSANWLEITGKAIIQHDNIEVAREQAIKRAVNDAAFKAGFKIISQQSVLNGLMQEQHTQIEYAGEVHRVEVISEDRVDNEYHVQLRVELGQVTATNQCQSSTLKSKILIPRATIAHQEQLRYGHLFGFSAAFVERLAENIQTDAVSYFTTLHTDSDIVFKKNLNQVRGYRFPSWLGKITNTQYILVPEIIDMSITPTVSYLMGLFESTPAREFQLRLTLFHSISGERIWMKDYSYSVPWEFDRNAMIEPQTELFWQSTYGRTIDKVIDNVVSDIDQTLSCRPTLGQLIARQNDRVVINLGRHHGVRVGDIFQIILVRHMFDRLSQLTINPDPSHAKITIQSVTEFTAIANLMDETSSLNIQINDLVLKSK